MLRSKSKKESHEYNKAPSQALVVQGFTQNLALYFSKIIEVLDIIIRCISKKIIGAGKIIGI
jgi:hypothetical protein